VNDHRHHSEKDRQMDTGAPFDEGRMFEFLGQVAGDAGAALAGVSTALGARLGLYAAMAGTGPLTAEQVAGRVDLAERYVREWLALQVANGYVVHVDGTYELPPEHAAVLADPNSPASLISVFGMLPGLYASSDDLAEAYRTGGGVDWGNHTDDLFAAASASFRPGYAAALVQRWLPAVDGVPDQLYQGITVADVGCGRGHSTVLMAKAFPKSRFIGFDLHLPSLQEARGLAEQEGVADRVTFVQASATDFPGGDYGLITYFDCLHDFGDPQAALTHAEKTLAADGTCLLVEPNAPATLADATSPIARVFYATSPILCLPAAMADTGANALGNHPGEDALRSLAATAGLHSWALAAESPVNRVYAVRR
jgi:SAM-dependent methyltransferase